MCRSITVGYAFKKDAKGERHGTPAERLLAEQQRKNAADQNRPNTLFAMGKIGRLFKMNSWIWQREAICQIELYVLAGVSLLVDQDNALSNTNILKALTVGSMKAFIASFSVYIY